MKDFTIQRSARVGRVSKVVVTRHRLAQTYLRMVYCLMSAVRPVDLSVPPAPQGHSVPCRGQTRAHLAPRAPSVIQKRQQAVVCVKLGRTRMDLGERVVSPVRQDRFKIKRTRHHAWTVHQAPSHLTRAR